MHDLWGFEGDNKCKQKETMEKKQKKLTNWTKDGSTSQVALPSLVTVGVTNQD